MNEVLLGNTISDEDREAVWKLAEWLQYAYSERRIILCMMNYSERFLNPPRHARYFVFFQERER